MHAGWFIVRSLIPQTRLRLESATLLQPWRSFSNCPLSLITVIPAWYSVMHTWIYTDEFLFSYTGFELCSGLYSSTLFMLYSCSPLSSRLREIVHAFFQTSYRPEKVSCWRGTRTAHYLCYWRPWIYVYPRLVTIAIVIDNRSWVVTRLELSTYRRILTSL